MGFFDKMAKKAINSSIDSMFAARKKPSHTSSKPVQKKPSPSASLSSPQTTPRQISDQEIEVAARIAEYELQRAAREEERKQAEEERSREQAERETRRAEAYAAYDKLMASIKNCPLMTSPKPAKKMAASFVKELKYANITKTTNFRKLGNYVAIDTETTGLRYSSDEIIDIAAIRFRDFYPVAKFSFLLAPKKPIPEEATKINHITNEMVEGQPNFQQVAEALLRFIGDDDLVGHNLPFDLKFIVHYGADVTTTKRKYYDTMALAQKNVKKARMKWDKEWEVYVEDIYSEGVSNYKLETLCRYLGIINKDAHRAESDAMAAGMLFQKLIQIRMEKLEFTTDEKLPMIV